MSILVFEDNSCDALSPISIGRLTYNITCGSLRLFDLLAQSKSSLYGICRPYLRDLQQADFPLVKHVCEDNQTKPSLLLSGRTVPSQANWKQIQKWLQSDGKTSEPQVVIDRESVIAVLNPPWSVSELLRGSYEELGDKLNQARNFQQASESIAVFNFPHEVVAQNMKVINENLQYRLSCGGFQEEAPGVFVKEDVRLGDYLTFDSSNGPVLIDSGVSVGPYTLLRGPLYIGPKSKILEHSAIKDCVSLGHTTKIGGEVEASVIEPYTNKQHHGFLGHSYLGSWINLGAGTCNSDLKNTYGLVNMEYPMGKTATGMQFLGCIVGDYSKTAINTGIFTGKVIGVCSMMYGFVTSNVPSFVNYARLFGQVESIPPEVMISTQQRVFARRNVQQRDIDIQLINDMFALTRNER